MHTEQIQAYARRKIINRFHDAFNPILLNLELGVSFVTRQ